MFASFDPQPLFNRAGALCVAKIHSYKCSTYLTDIEEVCNFFYWLSARMRKEVKAT